MSLFAFSMWAFLNGSMNTTLGYTLRALTELPQLFKHGIIVTEVLQPEHLFWLEWAQFKKFVSANYKRL
jgi:hypothetical protein